MTFIQKDFVSPQALKFNSKMDIRGATRGSFSFDLPVIGAYTSLANNVTITGIRAGDLFGLDRPAALSLGLIIAGYEIATPNILTFYIGNITAGAIDNGPVTFKYQWIDLT